MRIVSWNMGCGPRTAKYRKTHTEAWHYLLDELKPDIALIQEALFSAIEIVAQQGALFWSEEHGSDSGAAIFYRKGLQAKPIALQSEGSFLAGAEIIIPNGSFSFVSIHVGPGDYKHNVKDVFDVLEPRLKPINFVAGGDLNAAASP